MHHLVLVGPTASGKSALAMELARSLGDIEIVSMDSMQVYRGMDIGTATPSVAERDEVPHHLVDVVEPEDEHGVAEHQRLAREAIAAIEARGHRALLVGGTGLYVSAVVDDLVFPGRFPDVAAELAAEDDTAALHRRLVELDPVAADRMEPSNRRRVLRALEVTLGSGRPFSQWGPGLSRYPPTPFVMRGVGLDRTVLDARIAARYRAQVAQGFVEEVRALDARPGELSRTAAQALGYRELLAHLRGELSLEGALAEAITRTRRFARRQERWFRRDPRLAWRRPPDDEPENPMALIDALLEDFSGPTRHDRHS